MCLAHPEPGIGGGLVDPATYQFAEKKLIGSMMVYEAESLEAVRKLVEADIYYTSNVVSAPPALRRVPC